MRKKYQQQSEEEKLQELLKKWDIQLPNKEEKTEFPETSLTDFPKADFPESESKSEIQSEPVPPEPAEKKIKPEKKPESEIKLTAFLEKKTEKKESPEKMLSANPDLDKRFKQEVIQYMCGSVRMYSLESFIVILLLIVIGLTCMYDAFTAITVICFCMIFLIIWYMTRWELKFDGSTNRLSYRSLFHEEIQFHASQIQNVRMTGNFRPKLILTVYGQEIKISMGTMHVYVSKEGYRQEITGGYYNARKLKEYLDFYQDLHGPFRYAEFANPVQKSGSSSKEELLQMMAEYQKKIDDKKE